jgi:hypothetical protein
MKDGARCQIVVSAPVAFARRDWKRSLQLYLLLHQTTLRARSPARYRVGSPRSRA